MQTCRPLIVPTHSTIPIIRYETGLSKHAIQATIAQKEAPPAGLLFVNKTFNFEPGAARSALGGRSRSAAVVVEPQAAGLQEGRPPRQVDRLPELPERSWHGGAGSGRMAGPASLLGAPR